MTYYGERYESRRSVKEDAALIRATLRDWAKDPDHPLHGAKVSVRLDRASLSSSIRVTLTVPWHVSHTGEFSHADSEPFWCSGCGEEIVRAGRDWWYTPQARKVLELVRHEVESYNRDNSDPMTDYFDRKFWTRIELEEAPDGLD